jgi:acetolactate synthase-1/2/3 large subunit
LSRFPSSITKLSITQLLQKDSPMTSQLTGGEAIVHSLIALGVDTIFALPGVQNDYLFNALHDNKDKIRVIHTRHEQGAAYMAMGYALSLDRPGVYCVVPGPGFLNTTAALSTAYATNAKVLCLTGQIASDTIGKNIGLLHEIPDQLGVMERLTKWARRINSPEEAPQLLTEAFTQLLSGRPRPVGLEVPLNILSRKGEVDLSAVEPEIETPPLDLEAIERAAKLLGQAQNPMIAVGGGAFAAREAVLALAEMLQAPVISGRNGRGVVSNAHYLSMPGEGGYDLWGKADVVIGIGSRMYRPLARWGVDDDLTLIRIDIDPEAMDPIASPDLPIVADSREAVTALVAALGKYNRKRPSRREELLAYKANLEAKYAELEPQYSLVKAITEEMPDDALFVDEVTQIGYVSRFMMPVDRPRSYISTGYQGTLGFGFPTALGVKVGNPDKPVLNVTGDGGFMFNVQELATAVQQQIGLVTMIFADGAFGNVRRMQKLDYDNRLIASDLHNPDFVKLAEAFGAQGLRANSPDELRHAIREGLAEKGPTLIEIPVGEMPSPWHLSFPTPNRKGRK